MINPKPLLLGVLFLVGSCAPMQPASINIFNVIGENGEDRQLAVTCKDDGTYMLPPKPEFDDLADDDHLGIADRMSTHIDVLRTELRRIAKHGACGK